MMWWLEGGGSAFTMAFRDTNWGRRIKGKKERRKRKESPFLTLEAKVGSSPR
jgi:hypothetical protein